METRQEHREREGERIELKRETAKAESKRLRWPGRAVTPWGLRRCFGSRHGSTGDSREIMRTCQESSRDAE